MSVTLVTETKWETKSISIYRSFSDFEPLVKQAGLDLDYMPKRESRTIIKDRFQVADCFFESFYGYQSENNKYNNITEVFMTDVIQHTNTKMKVLYNGIAVIEGDTHISKWVEETGRLDHDQWYFNRIKELGLIQPGDTVIDGGAFIGDHTIGYLNLVGPTGNVYAFESNPDAFLALCHNVLNHDNCQITQKGLGNRHEYVSMKISSNSGASFLVKSGNLVFPAQEVNTLDKILSLSPIKRVNFIKLDIEGWEYLALLGAEETIKKYKPKMIIEINTGALHKQGHNPTDIFNLIIDYNYSWDILQPEINWLAPQYDIVCLPKI